MRALLLMTFSIVALSSAEARQSESDEFTGSYEILICKGPCDFADESAAVVRGLIVVAPRPPKARYRRQLKTLGFEFSYFKWEKPTVCAVLQTIDEDRTYAGINPLMVVSRSEEGSTVTFQLYSSPDAWQTTSLELGDEIVIGRGGSGGAGAAAPSFESEDVIVGRRVGDANWERCIERAKERIGVPSN